MSNALRALREWHIVVLTVILGVLSVEGPPNPDIYNSPVMPGMGH